MQLSAYYYVAIPSNRVNVSYAVQCLQTAQLNGMCRNPLKSGQCFLHLIIDTKAKELEKLCRNPLKSGQCFLRRSDYGKRRKKGIHVAIPSNRVNVSYNGLPYARHWPIVLNSRNPLKSGQCFLLI